MNKRDLAKFRKRIEAEIVNVKHSLGMIEQEISGRGVGAVGNQTYSNHMADVGTDAMEQEQAFMHASQGTGYLVALEQALKRIELGKYGVCEECGEKIPPRRLEAFLAARLCVPCKGRIERLRR